MIETKIFCEKRTSKSFTYSEDSRICMICGWEDYSVPIVKKAKNSKLKEISASNLVLIYYGISPRYKNKTILVDTREDRIKRSWGTPGVGSRYKINCPMCESDLGFAEPSIQKRMIKTPWENGYSILRYCECEKYKHVLVLMEDSNSGIYGWR